jgi:hypothetical protein
MWSNILTHIGVHHTTRSVPELWGCMYNVLARSANGARKRDEKYNSHAAKKGTNKLVSSNFVKILE